MAEIKELPPTYRIQPGAPTGKDRKTPVKQPATDHQDKKKRRRRHPDDKDTHLDEYA